MLFELLIKKDAMTNVAFISSQHPKNTIAPTDVAMASTLGLGWIAQKKMNGHRLQIHIEPTGKLTAFTRHGAIHSTALDEALSITFKAYAMLGGTIVFEGEWVKAKSEVHLFDILRCEGKLLSSLSYKERYEMLKSIFRIAPNVKLLPLYRTLHQCQAVMKSDDETIEGLVFKAWRTKGWPDTAIVRCLKKDI